VGAATLPCLVSSASAAREAMKVRRKKNFLVSSTSDGDEDEDDGDDDDLAFVANFREVGPPNPNQPL